MHPREGRAPNAIANCHEAAGAKGRAGQGKSRRLSSLSFAFSYFLIELPTCLIRNHFWLGGCHVA